MIIGFACERMAELQTDSHDRHSIVVGRRLCLLVAVMVAGCVRPSDDADSAIDFDPRYRITTVQHAATTDSLDPAKAREEVLLAIESGDTSEALRLGRIVFRASPDDPQSIFMMAQVFASRNRFAEAVRMLDELADDEPEMAYPVLGQTAEWLVLAGEWDEAERRFRELLTAVGDAPMVDRMLAQLLLRQGRRLEASKHLRKLCNAGDVEEYGLRALLTGLHPLENETAPDSEYDPIGVLGRARYLLSQGDWETALKLVGDALPADLPEAAALRGRILAHQDDLEGLRAWSEQADQIDPKSADYWFAIGVHESGRGKHREAAACFGQAVLLDSTDWHAYARLSEALQELGQEAAANMAADRSNLIQRSQALGKELVESDPSDREHLEELIAVLKELRRPFEALAWQGFLVYYGRMAGMFPDSVAMQKMNEINQKRKQRLASGESAATRDFLLCGADLEDLPPVKVPVKE